MAMSGMYPGYSPMPPMSPYDVYHTTSQSPTPHGLEAVYKTCRRLYPEQPNPLQVTAYIKYWLDGPDPLDYISMYSNPGNPDMGIPPHWHYVSFGLSDLYGDGRVHGISSVDGKSGFGFELTFRLKREGEISPPTWPAALMQSLARYVFQTDNLLCAGDHVPWHSSLDGSESRIQHMVMAEDAQLEMISTQFGSVSFVQIVGVCDEELQAVQHWNGVGVVDLLKTVPVAGGPWLVTDMRRGESIFDLDPTLRETVDEGIESEGSNLSGVSIACSWEEWHPSSSDDSQTDTTCDDEDKENNMKSSRISDLDSALIKKTLSRGLKLNYTSSNENESLSGEDQSAGSSFYKEDESLADGYSRKSSNTSLSSDMVGLSELQQTQILEGVHLTLTHEAACLLPYALRGRLRHGRHFTLKSSRNEMVITLVSSSVEGSIATEQAPYAAHGSWLQILFTENVIEDLLQELDEIEELPQMYLPKIYMLSEHRFCLTVLPNDTAW